MNTRAKQKSSSSKKKKTCTPKHDPETWATSEAALTEHLEEDLFEAWEKIRDFSSSLGQQRVYAAGKAIMFSKKTCFFFVRPKKSYLEVVVFLASQNKPSGFKSVKQVSKTRYAHTFKLIHADQVEGELTEAIGRAYETQAANSVPPQD